MITTKGPYTREELKMFSDTLEDITDPRRAFDDITGISWRERQHQDRVYQRQGNKIKGLVEIAEDPEDLPLSDKNCYAFVTLFDGNYLFVRGTVKAEISYKVLRFFTRHKTEKVHMVELHRYIDKQFKKGHDVSFKDEKLQYLSKILRSCRWILYYAEPEIKPSLQMSALEA